MAKKERFPKKRSVGFAANHESEGSGSSGRVDTEVTASEDSNYPKRKCMNLNYASRDGFAVPMQVLPLSKLSSSERRDLVVQLKSDLEKIRLLQKRVVFQRVNSTAVSSSSDILSCSNVRNFPQLGNFNKSTDLNSRSVEMLNPPSYKGRGWNRGVSGKFESAKQPPPTRTSDAKLMRQCEDLLKKLMSHQYGSMFNQPVDVVKFNIPDYFTIIKHPMDLGTIKKKILSSKYPSPLEFAADVRLTFSNAMTYNPAGNHFHFMADALSKFFEVRWKAIEKKLLVAETQFAPEKAVLREESEIIKPMPPSKKRKLSPVPQKISTEPIERVMTVEEKHKMSKDLEDALGDLPENVIEFLKLQSSNGIEGEVDEIEIDIDDLSSDALFTLRKLLDENMQNTVKKEQHAEPCVIELPNESGLSNSSMQLYKGNDGVDEDVDIVGNEPPVSSCPPIEIEKETSRRSNKSIGSDSTSDTDPSSGNESECEKDSIHVKPSKENSCHEADFDERIETGDLVDVHQSVSGLDQLEQNSQHKPSSVESDNHQDGESAPTDRQVSPQKLYRAALLKNRFADTIFKAREKNLNQGEKIDPEKLRREREELEMQRRKEKARLEAEVKAAEEARKRAEAEAAVEAKRKRELEREAARQALLKMEKTVEINESSQFLEDLEMLRSAPPDVLLPSSVDETSPDDHHSQDGFGSFKFSNNPLEQLGLYMKMDEEDEEAEPHSPAHIPNDVEEGEID